MKKGIYLVYMIVGFGFMAYILIHNFFTFSGGSAGEDSPSYVKTTAVVRELVTPTSIVRRRSAMLPALVTFKTIEGKTVDAAAMILRIPVYGLIADKGDTLTVFYNPRNPSSVRTYADKYNVIGGNLLFVYAGIIIGVCILVAFARIYRAKM